MPDSDDDHLVTLPPEYPVWDRFFTVAPLVVVGTSEQDGYDLAPKHMATPVGHGDHYGFVCTPRHRTYHNANRTGTFTVSYPQPSQILITSLTAAPHCGDEGSAASLVGLPVVPAIRVEGVLLANADAHLECELDRVIDGFGDASLIVGRVVRAAVRREALRATEVSDAELLGRSPLLAYVDPGRYATIRDTQAFPFPEGFEP